MKSFLVVLAIVVGATALFPSTSWANQLARDRMIVRVIYGFEGDIEWLESNYKRNDRQSIRVLADVYIKCKWLEHFNLTNSPITYCFYTNIGSSASNWLYKIKTLKTVDGLDVRRVYGTGEPLKATIWHRR